MVRPAAVAGACAVLALAACGGHGAQTARTTTTTTTAASAATASTRPHSSTTSAPRRRPAPPPPPGPPAALPAALGTSPTPGFVPAVRWRGRTAVWVDRTPGGVGLLRVDQSLAELHLHSGTVDAGSAGWRWGPDVAVDERPRLLAAFNGGFKLDTGAGGFFSYGRTGYPIHRGLGSIVTYAGGETDIGSWGPEVPLAGRPVLAVRQNLNLLIDHGSAAGNLSCLICWGATLGGVSAPARSALGITADHRLIWAGGANVTVADLASALLHAGAVRAVELDINPEWVAGYVYKHELPAAGLIPEPVVPGQHGIPGFFLAPYSRDFFTLVAR